MLLGVIVSSAFVAKPELKVILRTTITSSIALGISSGVSVYFAETLESERRISEMEESLLTSLKDSKFAKSFRRLGVFISLIIILTPLFVCAITISPLLLFSIFNLVEIKTAVYISIAAALGILFSAGVYMGQNGKGNTVLKGLMMAFFGAIAFIIGYLIEALI